MSSRRTLILIAAIALAVLAAFLNFAYLNSVEDRANENAKRVQVFVVKKDVAKGTDGQQAIDGELVQSDKIPQEFRPGTAITDINQIRGKVALTDLSAGQVVVDGMFVDPRVAQVTSAERIPAGMVAITVSVDQVRGVAGLLLPGDKVNIMATDKDGAWRHLYQNVQILFIGGTAAPEAGETEAVQNPGSGLITFAVPAEAAERIALAAQSMYLTLVPPDNQPVKVPPVNQDNLFGDKLTPYPDQP